MKVDVKETSKVKNDRSQCSKRLASGRTLYKEAFDRPIRME